MESLVEETVFSSSIWRLKNPGEPWITHRVLKYTSQTLWIEQINMCHTHVQSLDKHSQMLFTQINKCKFIQKYY